VGAKKTCQWPPLPPPVGGAGVTTTGGTASSPLPAPWSAGASADGTKVTSVGATDVVAAISGLTESGSALIVAAPQPAANAVTATAAR
jgi:hypothetical protein